MINTTQEIINSIKKGKMVIWPSWDQAPVPDWRGKLKKASLESPANYPTTTGAAPKWLQNAISSIETNKEVEATNCWAQSSRRQATATANRAPKTTKKSHLAVLGPGSGARGKLKKASLESPAKYPTTGAAPKWL